VVLCFNKLFAVFNVLLWCYFQELRCRFQSVDDGLLFKKLNAVFNMFRLFCKILDVVFVLMLWYCFSRTYLLFSISCCGFVFQELRCCFRAVAVMLFSRIKMSFSMYCCGVIVQELRCCFQYVAVMLLFKN
jgi:hypothetical protein